jgi:hypothetical protein
VDTPKSFEEWWVDQRATICYSGPGQFVVNSLIRAAAQAAWYEQQKRINNLKRILKG